MSMNSTADTKVGAILLAAGASRRMGATKQLLPLGGKSALERCLSALHNGGIEQVVVVVAPSDREVTREAAKFPVQVVRNSDPEGDMAASIRTGRDALLPDTSGVLIALCDYPLVGPDTVCLLANAHRDHPADIIIPCHGGRRGHPPLFPRHPLDGLQPPLTLRDLMQQMPEAIRHLEVDDPGVLIDMDTPEDYQRIVSLLQR